MFSRCMNFSCNALHYDVIFQVILTLSVHIVGYFLITGVSEEQLEQLVIVYIALHFVCHPLLLRCGILKMKDIYIQHKPLVYYSKFVI